MLKKVLAYTNRCWMQMSCHFECWLGCLCVGSRAKFDAGVPYPCSVRPNWSTFLRITTVWTGPSHMFAVFCVVFWFEICECWSVSPHVITGLWRDSGVWWGRRWSRHTCWAWRGKKRLEKNRTDLNERERFRFWKWLAGTYYCFCIRKINKNENEYSKVYSLSKSR